MALDAQEFPQKCKLAVISDDEADVIHGQALELLERKGLLIEHEGARRLLREAGARTDEGSGMVRFPPRLVRECLGSVPRRIIYGARDPAADLFFQTGGRVYCRPISGLELYLDPRTGERRQA